MGSYFKKNTVLISINLIYALSIFFSMVIIPSILVKEYHLSSTIISISGFIFASSFLITTIISKELLKRKYNFFKSIRYILIGSIILYLLFFLSMKYKIIEHYQWIFILFKIMEGILVGLFNHTINHIFVTKLIENKKKVEIKGTQNTFYYIVKAVGPLIGSIFIVAYGSINIFIVSALIAFIALIILEINSKKLLKRHWKETFNLAKYQKRLVIKKITLKRLKFNKEFLLKSELTKQFYLTTYLHNTLRFFYDFYYVIFVTTVLHITYVQSGFLIAVLIFGQSTQFLSSILMTKIKKIFKESYFIDSLWLIYSLPVSLFGFLLYLHIYKIEVTNLVYLIIVGLTGLTGFSRAMFASFSDYYIFKIIEQDKRNLAEYNAIMFIVGDIGNLSGYIIGGIMIWFGYDVMLVYMISMLLIYLVVVTNRKIKE